MLKIFLKLLTVPLCLFALCACQAPSAYLQQADEAAYAIIAAKQAEIGTDFPLSIQQPEQRLRQKLLMDQHLTTSATVEADESFVDADAVEPLSLVDALQVAAHNSRSYQLNKETVFRRALALDLERDAFRSSFAGLLTSTWSTDKSTGERVSGLIWCSC